LSEHQASAARSPIASPSGPEAGDAERFATERGLRIEVETKPDGRRLRYVSREPEPGSPKADGDV
jgi:hypothetical protein